jgi:SAM-dependent methyltransferase
MMNENETPLAISWLNNREKYDRTARSPEVRDVFFAELGKAHIKLADLGCGTGSNSLFLSENLNSCSAEFHLVEREAYLLEEARRRIKEKNAECCEERNDGVYLKKGDYQHAFYFYNELVREFMRRNVDVQAVCASALFDLFTEDEFNDLLKRLKSGNMSLYGVLNYCGTDFSPSCRMDVKFINFYENHMSRLLRKGRPLGKRTMTYVQDVLNPQNGWDLTVSNSNWILNAEDSEFISQNLDFYENAVPELIFHQEERTEFNEWMAEKRSMIAQRKLAMRVYHQDFFARCL